MSRCGVYKIECIPASLIYIGSSKDIDGRWKSHERKLRSNIHHNLGLQIAWNEHGDRAFMWSVIEEIPPDGLKVREQYWIDYHRKLKAGKASNIQGASSDQEAVNFEIKQAFEMENRPCLPGVWPWEKCRACDGCGYANSPIGRIRCSRCGGTGKEPPRRKRR